MPGKPQDPIKRFWKKIDKTETCWIWKGKLTEDGYGIFYHENKRIKGKMFSKYKLAHRYSWELAKGPITDTELCVLHHCDNRPCIRPDHLFLGTRKDNNLDMVRKQRHRGAPGERNNKAKLTIEQVVKIRKLFQAGAHISQLAYKYNISPGAIFMVVHRITWKHI